MEQKNGSGEKNFSDNAKYSFEWNLMTCETFADWTGKLLSIELRMI